MATSSNAEFGWDHLQLKVRSIYAKKESLNFLLSVCKKKKNYEIQEIKQKTMEQKDNGRCFHLRWRLQPAQVLTVFWFHIKGNVSLGWRCGGKRSFSVAIRC